MGRRKQTWKFFLFATTFLLQKPEANKKRQSIYKLSVFISISILCVSLFFFFTEGRLRDHDRVLLSYYMQLRPQHGTNCDLFSSFIVRSK